MLVFRRKYRNSIVGEDGLPYDKKRHKMKFDSAKEWRCWTALKAREAQGEIRNLRLQVTYPFSIGEHKICKYIADFVFDEGEMTVVADAKGVKTPVFQIKKKLMKALYGITILEL